MTDWIEFARRWVPKPVRVTLQRAIPLTSIKDRWRERNNTLAGVVSGEGRSQKDDIRVGILRTRALFHTVYVSACQELGVPFVVLDIASERWLDAARKSDCTVFLAWPDATLTPWAKMYKDR